MKLAIISHTPHYSKDGSIVGWGPTIREINFITSIFSEIYHLAPLHGEPAPGSSLPYSSSKVKFVALKPYGGKTFADKLKIVTTAFYNLGKIRSILQKVDWVQFRAPTAMGLYVLPYLSVHKKPKRWVKYAGNWKMERPPFSYAVQRWWLEKNLQKSYVTINGQWEGQKNHILNFINPCLDNDEIQRALEISKKKNFENKLVICFVGTLTKNKGIEIILKALKSVNRKNEIDHVIFAGDGEERSRYEKEASEISVKISFLGFVTREELEKVYEQSHIILLPSESEGFPKVIAEAAAYGCVPIVSNVSSISLYFNNVNGFLLDKVDASELSEKIDEALGNREKLRVKSGLCTEIAKQFTFENYVRNLKDKILKTDVK